MDKDKVAQKFQELWSAVTEEHAQHQTLYIGQKEDGRLTSRNTPEGKQSVMDNMKEQRSRVANVAQVDHERKMAGNYGGNQNQTPTSPKIYAVWEALERTEKAREGLHIVINELHARLEGVLDLDDSPIRAAPQPPGNGMALREGLNAQSIEDAIYRLRSIINRLTL